MINDFPTGYLDGLPADQRAELARVNGPGLAALRGYLASGEAVAFLGAGVSAPLYPLWDGLIGELVDAAAGRLSAEEARRAGRWRRRARRRWWRSCGSGWARRVPGGAAGGAAGADRPGVGAVVDAGAGTGVPVRVQGGGDHEL